MVTEDDSHAVLTPLLPGLPCPSAGLLGSRRTRQLALFSLPVNSRTRGRQQTPHHQTAAAHAPGLPDSTPAVSTYRVPLHGSNTALVLNQQRKQHINVPRMFTMVQAVRSCITNKRESIPNDTAYYYSYYFSECLFMLHQNPNTVWTVNKHWTTKDLLPCS